MRWLDSLAMIQNTMKNKFTVISSLAIAVAIGLVQLAAGADSPTPNESTVKSKSNITNNKQAGTGLSSQDKEFMKNAAKGGLMEVQWGKAASDYAKDPDVKKFGKRMMTDHSKANNELMALAKRKGVALSQEQASVKWRGERDYMDMMVDDHQKDLKEFTAEAKNGNDPDVKKFADDTAKVVNQHLQLAKQVRMKLQ